MDTCTAKAIEEILRDARRLFTDIGRPTNADSQILEHIEAAIVIIRQEHESKFDGVHVISWDERRQRYGA